MKVEEIKLVAIVGAGLMGHGIAQEFSLAGNAVDINVVSDEKLQQALNQMRNNLKMLEGFWLVTKESCARSTLARLGRAHTESPTVEICLQAQHRHLD